MSISMLNNVSYAKGKNIVPVKYSQGHFSAPMAPMEFISMDLIGDFILSSKGNKYALTVICMLTGYTFCIPIPSKKASDVVTAYVENCLCQVWWFKENLIR